MFVVLGYRDIRIKERIPSTTADVPFREHHLQNNLNGISDIKPLHQSRFFSVFWIPIFPLYCVQSLRKTPEGEYYERKTSFQVKFLNWLVLVLVILLGVFVLFPRLIFFWRFKRFQVEREIQKTKIRFKTYRSVFPNYERAYSQRKKW